MGPKDQEKKLSTPSDYLQGPIGCQCNRVKTTVKVTMCVHRCVRTCVPKGI